MTHKIKKPAKIDKHIELSKIKEIIEREGYSAEILNNCIEITGCQSKAVKKTIEAAESEQPSEILIKLNKLGLKIEEDPDADIQLKLEDSKARLKALSDASFESIFLSVNGICIDQNLTAEKMFGYTEGEAIGKPGTDWIIPEEREHVKDKMLSGIEIPYKTTALRKDGSIFPAEIQGRMINYRGRNVRVTALRDITDAKKTEEELLLFKKAVENSTNGVGMTDTSGKVIYQNKALSDMLEKKSEDPISHYVDKSIGKEIFKDLTSGKGWNGEVQIYGKKREILTIYLRAYTINNEEDKAVRFVGIHTNITKRVKAERILATSEQSLNNILNSINDGVYIVNQQYGIQYINPVIKREFGPINNRKCYNYFHGRTESCPWCKNEEVFKGKSVSWEWYSRKTNKYYDLFDTPFINPDGSISKLEIFHDISKLKELEQFLVANKEELKKSNLQIENAHKHAMYMLAIASEYKDTATGGHIQRIAKLTTELALELGIEPKQAEQIGDDSLLHDLGKLGISDSILLKPGKLTKPEFELIKQHTIIGANIIGDDEWFAQSHNITLSHHEKWDGSGYPKGLKGSDIPFAARIVAVVDVFDALLQETI